MKITVIQWRVYSPYVGKDVLIELAYPLRSRTEAEKMFRCEYPESRELKFYEF